MSLCPTCGYEPDYASNMTGKASPRPGDYSLCINCGTLLVFDDDLKLAEFEGLPQITLDALVKIRLSQAFIRNRGPLHPNDKPT